MRRLILTALFAAVAFAPVAFVGAAEAAQPCCEGGACCDGGPCCD